MKKIAILASGEGTNAENIVRCFADDGNIKVELLLSDRENAPVLGKMERYGIPVRVFLKAEWREHPEGICGLLRSHGIDLVVLAGFTSIVSGRIIADFPNRILNLHPSLLPKFGGKGMWGMNVHRAVIEAGEKESGISVHYVSEEVDGGEVIAQFRCPVDSGETPESLVAKVHALEYEHYPEVIRQVLAEG